jgi:hypothetical protein
MRSLCLAVALFLGACGGDGPSADSAPIGPDADLPDAIPCVPTCGGSTVCYQGACCTPGDCSTVMSECGQTDVGCGVLMNCGACPGGYCMAHMCQ